MKFPPLSLLRPAPCSLPLNLYRSFLPSLCTRQLQEDSAHSLFYPLSVSHPPGEGKPVSGMTSSLISHDLILSWCHLHNGPVCSGLSQNPGPNLSWYARRSAPPDHAVPPSSTWAQAFHQLHLMLLVPRSTGSSGSGPCPKFLHFPIHDLRMIPALDNPAGIKIGSAPKGHKHWL